MRSWCLCQICTCGRHHCPHGTTRIYENSGVYCPTTEYLEKYPAYGSALPAQSLKPKQTFRAYRAHSTYTAQTMQELAGSLSWKYDDGQTCHMFGIYQMNKGRIIVLTKSSNSLAMFQKNINPNGEIDLGTTYKRDFNSYNIPPVAIVRPLEGQVKKGKLDTVPTYKDDYRAWDVQKSKLYKPEQAYYAPTMKFGNSTTFQDNYLPWEIQPRLSFKPSSMVQRPAIPFNGDTSHRLDYAPYQLESKPARPKEVYRPTNQPFEDLTTHRCHFQGLVGETAKICKPAHTRVSHNAPFEGSTEFRDSFPPWETPPLKFKKVQEYMPPTGAMQLHSTSHLDYIPHQATRVVPIRPISHRRNHHFPFQGQSTTKADFPAWASCRQGLIKRQQQIPNPSGKFDGLTTFRSHYVPHELIATQSCRPVNAPRQSSRPFEDVTMYSTEYAPKKQEICPASYPSPPGYIFENTNPQGHKFFRKITPTGKAF